MRSYRFDFTPSGGLNRRPHFLQSPLHSCLQNHAPPAVPPPPRTHRRGPVLHCDRRGRFPNAALASFARLSLLGSASRCCDAGRRPHLHHHHHQKRRAWLWGWCEADGQEQQWRWRRSHEQLAAAGAQLVFVDWQGGASPGQIRGWTHGHGTAGRLFQDDGAS